MAAISSSLIHHVGGGTVSNHHLFETSDLPVNHFELAKTSRRIIEATDCLTTRSFDISTDFYKNSKFRPNSEKLRFIDEEFIEGNLVDQSKVKFGKNDIFNAANNNSRFYKEETIDNELLKEDREMKTLKQQQRQQDKHNKILENNNNVFVFNEQIREDREIKTLQQKQTKQEKHEKHNKTSEYNNNVFTFNQKHCQQQNINNYKNNYFSEAKVSEISDSKLERINDRELLEKITFGNDIKVGINVDVNKKVEKKKKKRRNRKIGDEQQNNLQLELDGCDNNDLGLVLNMLFLLLFFLRFYFIYFIKLISDFI